MQRYNCKLSQIVDLGEKIDTYSFLLVLTLSSDFSALSVMANLDKELLHCTSGSPH